MVRKSPIDKCNYQAHTLSNGLKILTISDPKADKAGCSLSVNVGSYDELKGIEGLAHFLEHMLFMGTKEYPGENDYMDFLSKHNGESNAYTSNDNTVYYFDVSLPYFEEALKRFSSFFKCPLFLEDSVAREISAVHSEFLNGRCSDDWRLFRMFQLCCKENLPESQFNVGNKDTLDIKDIHCKVKEFWKSKYSPEKMCLVLYSNSDSDGFREYFKFFEGIPKGVVNSEGESGLYGAYTADTVEKGPNDSIEKDNCGSFKSLLTVPDIFKNDLKNKIIRVEPIKDQTTLNLSIVIPSEFKMIKTMPYVYLGHLFSKEDEDGFVKILKDKELGFYATFTVQSTLTYGILKIIIGLTTKGFKSIQAIKDLVVEYFSNIKYPEEEYKRLSDLKALQFAYKEMEDPIDCVESLSELMQYVPLENVLDYSFLLSKWDETHIKGIVSLILNTSNWIVFLVTKEGTFSKEDELYKIKFSIED